MTVKKIIDNAGLVAGITLKDPDAPEQNNMALHVSNDAEAVRENRRHLAAVTGTELGHFVCAAQTHSANVRKVTQVDRGRGAFSADEALPDTDALYTTDPDVLLCSFSADCVPVIFWEEESGVIGTIHSGWQGTAKEITRHTLRRIEQEEQTDLSQLHVWIGPAISQRRFEVDEDVAQLFQDLGYADEWITYNEPTGKYHIDNQQVVREQCLRAGVDSRHIAVEPFCTYEEEHGFSHRRDRSSGRHLAFIMKRV